MTNDLSTNIAQTFAPPPATSSPSTASLDQLASSFNKETVPATNRNEYNFSPAETNPPPEAVDADQKEVQELESSIETYLKKNAQQTKSYKDTITIGADQTALDADQYSNQPTIVLPVTKEQVKSGQHQSPLTGIRWLVEWSKKLMKKFVGRFIYKKTPPLAPVSDATAPAPISSPATGSAPEPAIIVTEPPPNNQLTEETEEGKIDLTQQKEINPAQQEKIDPAQQLDQITTHE